MTVFILYRLGISTTVIMHPILNHDDAMTITTPQPSSAPSTDPSSQPWLVIGITTVTRPLSATYLQDTIFAYNASLHHYYNVTDIKETVKTVKLVIFNSDDNHTNSIFYKMKDEFKYSPYFEFINNEHKRLTINQSLILKNNGFQGWNYPVALRKEQQSIDLASLIQYVSGHNILNKTQYLMFAEDDSVIRSDGMHRIIKSLSSIDNQTFAFARLSYGFNGIVIRSYDLNNVYSALIDKSWRIPCDYIINNYAKQHSKTRKVIDVYDKNDPFKLYKHIGVHSSVQGLKFAKNQTSVRL